MSIHLVVVVVAVAVAVVVVVVVSGRQPAPHHSGCGS